MDEKTVMLELPAPVYADLEALAADERQDPAGIIATWVDTARQRRNWLRNLEALREQIRQDGGLQIGTTKEQVVEQMRKTRQEIWEAEYAHLYR